MRINEVVVPASIGEALASMKRYPDAVFGAGCTSILNDDIGDGDAEAHTLISLHSIPELRVISRTDRYVEVGSMTPLSDLLSLKEGLIPEAFRKTLKGVGNFAIRNLATIGGNLSSRTRFRDCFPVLACLDTLAEFRSSSASRWITLNRLIGPQGLPEIAQGELLTRIRIPLAEWSVHIVQKIGAPREYSNRGALFILLAKMSKRTILDFRIFYSSERALRNRDIEASLTGKKVPLSARDMDATLASYAELCKQTELSEIHSIRFQSLLRRAFVVLEEGAVD